MLRAYFEWNEKKSLPNRPRLSELKADDLILLSDPLAANKSPFGVERLVLLC